MTDKQRQAILEAVSLAKKSKFGVTAIKVELEANLNRDGDFYSENYCHSWFMERLEQLGLAYYDSSEYEELGHSNEDTDWHPTGALAYAEFYNDGSVDSEFTFTIKLDNPENIFLIPRVIEVFKELAEENGNGMDVGGAGMHMAFINSSDCSYPTAMSSTQYRMFQNFSKSMRMLLPALYFLGTSNERSRGLGYRRPSIGHDTHRSAIDYRNGALEFRVFDTCYDKPEAVLDNFVVMSRSLRYWRDKYLPSGLNKIAKSYNFGVESGSDLSRLYVTHTHLDLLNQGLVRLKPSYYTIREIKQQRKFNTNKHQLNNALKNRRKQAENEYSEYEERYEWQSKSLKHQLIQRRYSMMAQGIYIRQENMDTEEQILAEVEAELRQADRSKKTLAQYVRERLEQTVNIGDYNITA